MCFCIVDHFIHGRLGAFLGIKTELLEESLQTGAAENLLGHALG